MSPLYIPLLLGSVRIGRRSEDVARVLLNRLQRDERVRTEWLDVAEYRFEILQQRPADAPSVPKELEIFSAKLRAADGLLIVAPEYKGGIPGALKNVFDLLEPGILRRKAVGICSVSAGGFGGLNCLAQLRHTVLALQGVPIPEILPISRVQELFDEDGKPRPGAKPIEAGPFLEELYFYAHALRLAKHEAEAAKK